MHTYIRTYVYTYIRTCIGVAWLITMREAKLAMGVRILVASILHPVKGRFFSFSRWLLHSKSRSETFLLFYFPPLYSVAQNYSYVKNTRWASASPCTRRLCLCMLEHTHTYRWHTQTALVMFSDTVWPFNRAHKIESLPPFSTWKRNETQFSILCSMK